MLFIFYIYIYILDLITNYVFRRFMHVSISHKAKLKIILYPNFKAIMTER
jgi:hypothetical protein